MKHIENILSNFLQPDVVRYYTRESTFKYWNRALTHPSVNIFDNYEKLEYLGDGSLELSFITYVRDIIGIKEYSVSNSLQNYYMSKKYQPIIATKLNLLPLIKIDSTIPLTVDIKEDIFESFFGTFTLIGRNLWLKNPDKYKHPTEYIIDFFVWYFKDLDHLDIIKNGVGPVKSEFLDIYRFFTPSVSPQKREIPKYNPKNKQIYFNSEFLTGLSKYSKNASDEIRKILTTKGMNENDYYISIFEVLEKYNLNTKWFKEEKIRTSFGPELKNIASENGFTRFVLERNNNSYDLIAQKVDEDKNSVSILIYSFGKCDDFNKLKNNAIKMLNDRYNNN